MTFEDIVNVMYFDTRIILIESEIELFAGQLGDLPLKFYAKEKTVKRIKLTQRGDLIYEVIEV